MLLQVPEVREENTFLVYYITGNSCTATSGEYLGVAGTRNESTGMQHTGAVDIPYYPAFIPSSRKTCIHIDLSFCA